MFPFYSADEQEEKHIFVVEGDSSEDPAPFPVLWPSKDR